MSTRFSNDSVGGIYESRMGTLYYLFTHNPILIAFSVAWCIAIVMFVRTCVRGMVKYKTHTKIADRTQRYINRVTTAPSKTRKSNGRNKV